MTYNGLKYKVKGRSDPAGKTRVYFCGHHDDYVLYFEEITSEIFRFQSNVTVYYHDEDFEIDESFLSDLSQMSLFVVPVTSAFLYTWNMARCIEFQYAKEHHIPLLPLAMEEGLEADFNGICGDYQILSKTSRDSTELPYEDKISRFLSSIVIADELSQKIRDAFDAYIFLSYRKKDRQYAQRIMNLIHENEFCRDIAIWYDEFLVPGENFNDAIEKAMVKSRLFTMVVTPNLLEKPNYVMDIEYPVAQDMKKEILPIDIVGTDLEAIKDSYAGIPPIADEQGIADRLKDALRSIALLENDSDPKHNFFIGLAYLNGVDVEVNHKRAFSLIEGAASQGLPEACAKMVEIYRYGQGVAVDFRKAIDWQYRYLMILGDRYKEKDDPDLLEKLVEGAEMLGHYDHAIGNSDAALTAFRLAHSYHKSLIKARPSTSYLPLVSLVSLIIAILIHQGNRTEALKWGKYLGDLGKKIMEKEDSPSNRVICAKAFAMFSTACYNAASYNDCLDALNQSFNYIKDTDPRQCDEEISGQYLEVMSLRVKTYRSLKMNDLYKKALDEYCESARKIHDHFESRNSLLAWARALFDHGSYLLKQNDEKGVSELEELTECLAKEKRETGFDSSLMAQCAYRVAEFYIQRNEMAKALNYALKAHEIYEQYYHILPSSYVHDFGRSSGQLGHIYNHLENEDRARAFYQKSIDLSLKYHQISNSEAARSAPVSAYYGAALFETRYNHPEAYAELLNKANDYASKNTLRQGNPSISCMNVMVFEGMLDLCEDDISQMSYLEKIIGEYAWIVKCEDKAEDYGQLADHEIRLAELLDRADNDRAERLFEGAADHYKKAEKMDDRYALPCLKSVYALADYYRRHQDDFMAEIYFDEALIKAKKLAHTKDILCDILRALILLKEDDDERELLKKELSELSQ